MHVNEINYLIRQGEGLKIEFKEAKDSVPHSFYDTVVSFANTDGGTILLGVDDNGKVTGIDPEAKIKLQKDIITAMNSKDVINPPMYIQPIVVNHPDGEILVIQVPSGSQIHKYKNRIYSREFESDLDVTDNQQKVGDMFLRKRNFFTESQIIPHLTMDDLDPALFDKARQIIRNYRSDHPWLLVGNEQLLKESVLWRKDFLGDGKEGMTLAAALIFGKDTTIQSILPAYKVEAMVRIQNKDRWDDRINPPLRTNLIDTYLLLKEFINKHLPEKFFMEGDQRVDLRDKIFREVIGNIIVHREYTSAFSTELIITGTEVRITNPNKPLFHGIIHPDGFNPFPKNPNIRKFFTAFGWTDEIGSGIRNSNKYLPLYADGAKPVFYENDTFITEIPLQHLTLAKFSTEFIAWLGLGKEAEMHLCAGLTNIALPATLSDATWEDLLLHLVPGWHQNGTQLTLLKWPDKQLFEKSEMITIPSWAENGTQPDTTKVASSTGKGTKSDNLSLSDYQSIMSDYIKKVPSSTEKGTKLIAKKSWYLISVLTLAASPLSRDELMKFLNYGNRKTFNDLYMQPLLQSGLVTRTNIEKPRAANQQYVITDEGKAFLGGML
jgi:ATP-dependent DNA helicase RecG